MSHNIVALPLEILQQLLLEQQLPELQLPEQQLLEQQPLEQLEESPHQVHQVYLCIPTNDPMLQLLMSQEF